MAERKLVEVFIDTDSDSESHTSSEVAVGSDNDMADTEDTYEEVGVVSEGEEPRELEMVPGMSLEGTLTAKNLSTKCGPNIIQSSFRGSRSCLHTCVILRFSRQMPGGGCCQAVAML